MATTNRNGRIFVHEGFTFTHTGRLSKNGEEIWQCQKRRNPACKVRIRTIGQPGLEEYVNNSQLHVHNHAPQPANVEARHARAHIKHLAATTQEPTEILLAQAKAMLSNSGKAALGTDEALKRLIRRARNRADKTTPNPTHKIGLEIPNNCISYETEPDQSKMSNGLLQCDDEIWLQISNASAKVDKMIESLQSLKEILTNRTKLSFSNLMDPIDFLYNDLRDSLFSLTSMRETSSNSAQLNGFEFGHHAVDFTIENPLVKEEDMGSGSFLDLIKDEPMMQEDLACGFQNSLIDANQASHETPFCQPGIELSVSQTDGYPPTTATVHCTSTAYGSIADTAPMHHEIPAGPSHETSPNIVHKSKFVPKSVLRNGLLSLAKKECYCKECKVIFKRTQGRNHVATSHLGTETFGLECCLCSYKTHWKTNYMCRHFERDHPGEKVYFLDKRIQLETLIEQLVQKFIVYG